MKKQNQDKMDNLDEIEDNDQTPNGIDVDFSMEQVSVPDLQAERQIVKRIGDVISHNYTLIKKQKIAYEVATDKKISQGKNKTFNCLRWWTWRNRKKSGY